MASLRFGNIASALSITSSRFSLSTNGLAMILLMKVLSTHYTHVNSSLIDVLFFLFCFILSKIWQTLNLVAPERALVCTTRTNYFMCFLVSLESCQRRCVSFYVENFLFFFKRPIFLIAIIPTLNWHTNFLSYHEILQQSFP